MGVNFTRNQVAKEKQRIETTRPTGFTFPLGLTFGKLVVASQNAFPTSTGGTKTTDSTNSVHTFTTSGTFKPSFTGTIEYLGIAGGGGGGPTGPGGGSGGGGGAGGLVYLHNAPVERDVSYTITVGAGGAASPGTRGSNTNTTIPTIVESIGGGAFGFGGGSAGGAPGARNASAPGTVHAGVQGPEAPQPSTPPAGGLSLGNPNQGSRGGGGAGAPGTNPGAPYATPTAGGGGAGYAMSISGTRVGYAGGGGGIAYVINGSPTNIPTGSGGHGGDGPGTSASANRGSGGGGCNGFGAGGGGGGGSGIVIVRYISNQELEGYFIT